MYFFHRKEPFYMEKTSSRHRILLIGFLFAYIVIILVRKEQMGEKGRILF